MDLVSCKDMRQTNYKEHDSLYDWISFQYQLQFQLVKIMIFAFRLDSSAAKTPEQEKSIHWLLYLS